jgi:diguanylate cyclase (GGDEF)-like protein
MLVVELGAIIALRIDILRIILLDSIRQFELFQWVTVVPATLTITILVLSMLALRMKFHLGGVLGGTIILFCGGWYLGPLSFRSSFFDSYIFAVTPVFLGLGILVHWIVRMEHRASYDPLLRVYNRDHCEKIISEQVGIRTSPPFGIAIVDIDNFKKVNDTYGHKIGDEVLIKVARVLSTELVPEGIVCRYGGDEFVVFFPRKNSKKVKTIMDKARKKVKGAVVRSGNKSIRVRLSIGISHRKNSNQELSEVLKAADKALYRAKKQGRDQIRYSTG